MNKETKEEEKEIKKPKEVKKEKKLSKEEKLSKELQEYKDKYLRSVAELENFKKRMIEEKVRERKYALMDPLLELVTILENFDKAVNMKTDDNNLKNFLIGFKMINDQLFNYLSNQGVTYIQTSNKVFDPKYHQAVDYINDNTKKDGLIIEELNKGYMFKDRVLKPSTVKINKIEKEKESR